jgi:hypothetical protein
VRRERASVERLSKSSYVMRKQAPGVFTGG